MISRHDSAYFDEEISTAQRRCFHFYFWWSKKMVSKTSLNFLVSIILPRHQRRGVTFFFVLEFFFLCCCYCCWFNTLFSFRELKIYWRCWLVFVAILLHFYPFQGEDEDLTIYGCFGIYISFMVILWRIVFEIPNYASS